ncbi:Acetoin:2,6-dichlorophenolindophenol oxidoreductase subunit alpha [Pigmentiphaga humi]|uniref:Acetoin:2,6-dichlorophenolindophenol oxidoreductase subunit alpha n=1 Tax=Pigmentiphaga humi TaxID=2478468 RepID=A0A3P4AZ91_9BURK|nr:thiamine pyrophosphate-dependent dehydrogenase E1 component subunit alpha [Pigmentiphaga humi]VCU69357.1 Acetoin:2,6-dichlorophenolindophenol oxidoreductase subunit alpha [Pigmentiphaga humi]
MTRAKLDADTRLRIFERMLTMRRLEETVFDLAARGIMVGHFHVYIGQESAGAAMLQAAGPGELLLSTHRNHGHLVGRGADPGRMLAEFLGRADGLNRGRGGTLHGTDRSLGFLQTSAVVGGIAPLATGAAYSLQRQRRQDAVIAFFGDGALEEGCVFESFNIAALWKLPIVYVCENNSVGAIGREGGGYNSSVNATTQFTTIPKVYGIETRVHLDGNDIDGIYLDAVEALQRARNGEGPTFIEAVTTRWPGSQPLWPVLATGITRLEVAYGTEAPSGEHAGWIADHDPVLRIARELLAEGVGIDTLKALDGTIRQKMDRAVDFALASPLPDPATATDYLFA